MEAADLTFLRAGAAQKLYCIAQIQERKAERAFESLNYASNIYEGWKIPVS